jgi:carbamoyltransferase
MNILGVNSGRAAPPRVDRAGARPLSDGAAAVVANGSVSCAVIEERLARSRYAHGFRHSAPACLTHAGLRINEIGAVGHSTCCDLAWSRPDDILDDLIESLEHDYALADLRGLKGRVFSIDHHESHAALAFAGSGFAKALVVIADGMGNRRGLAEDFNVSATWWRGAFQRQDYYLCEWRGGRIHFEKVHEDAGTEGEIGLGELYRSVTHFLGWPSYQYAGKTMALAAYGQPLSLADAHLVRFVPPHSIWVCVSDSHNDPLGQISSALERAGYKVPDVRRPASPDEPFLCDVAALVQHQLETALEQAVFALVERYGVRDIAFGGGVAMNCVALGKLAATRPDLRLYVPPAPADTGQALGNALWLAYAERSPVAEAVPLAPIRSAALGIAYSTAAIDVAVAEYVRKHPSAVTATRYDDFVPLTERVTDDLAVGKVVGWRQGRSEYGPRALGQASILADPRRPDAPALVNACKRRESFRPYAPSILAEHVAEYMEIATPSPFMSFAGTIRAGQLSRIPAVAHVDGTARYQSVAPTVGAYRSLMETWYRRSGVPVLLNTSFNRNGEPIVETPQDALECFDQTALKVLALGPWHLEKSG